MVIGSVQHPAPQHPGTNIIRGIQPNTADVFRAFHSLQGPANNLAPHRNYPLSAGFKSFHSFKPFKSLGPKFFFPRLKKSLNGLNASRSLFQPKLRPTAENFLREFFADRVDLRKLDSFEF